MGELKGNQILSENDARYLKIVLDPIRVSADYKPKFGKGNHRRNRQLKRKFDGRKARIQNEKLTVTRWMNFKLYIVATLSILGLA